MACDNPWLRRQLTIIRRAEMASVSSEMYRLPKHKVPTSHKTLIYDTLNTTKTVLFNALMILLVADAVKWHTGDLT